MQSLYHYPLCSLLLMIFQSLIAVLSLEVATIPHQKQFNESVRWCVFLPCCGSIMQYESLLELFVWLYVLFYSFFFLLNPMWLIFIEHVSYV